MDDNDKNIIKKSNLGHDLSNSEVNQEDYAQNLDNKPDIDEGLSKVAISKSSNILFLLALILVLGLVIYYSFFSSDDKPKKISSEINHNIAIVKPPEIVPIPAPVLDLPPAPKLEVPQAIKSPELPVVPSLVKPAEIKPVVPLRINKERKEDVDKRRKSSISLKSGNVSTNLIEAGGLQVQNLAPSGNTQLATKMSDLRYLIAQGKVIDATLESAITTDLIGSVRAILTSDVYAEQGNNILLPKGSRLIGTYDSNVKVGQNRVNIVWQRVMRPDGIDVMINSTSVDNLGRAGTVGIVETGYLQAFTNAMLVSAVNFAVAKYADKLQTQYNASNSTTNQGSTTVINLPGTTSGTTFNNQSQSQASQAISQASKDLGDLTKKIIDENLKTGPKIFIDQGTKIKVFVQKDLVFPTNIHSNLKVIE